MRTRRYATSRQKACVSCSSAKAKCDRKAGCCTRCARRKLACTYVQPPSSEHSTPSADHSPEEWLNDNTPSVASTQPMHHVSPSYTLSSTSYDRHTSNGLGSGAIPFPSAGVERFDFTNLELFCPIRAEDISNRWLSAYVPSPGQKVKQYSPSITAYIYRILNSYVSVAIRGRGTPPFVHAHETTPLSMRPPLSTCLALVRMCEKSLPGNESVIVDVFEREMHKLYAQHSSYDEMSLLEAFQAYLIYSMVLFFRLSNNTYSILRQAVMHLQELACSCSQRGLVCVAEQRHARPKWEAWIVAEAKRRTLYTMYFFDSLLSAQDGLPTMIGTELTGLPAPSSQVLWRAATRREWEMAYNIHVADWPKGGLRIDELWPVPPDMAEESLLERRSRVDQWLESVDEYGTMLYAVTSCTHGT